MKETKRMMTVTEATETYEKLLKMLGLQDNETEIDLFELFLIAQKNQNCRPAHIIFAARRSKKARF